MEVGGGPGDLRARGGVYGLRGLRRLAAAAEIEERGMAYLRRLTLLASCALLLPYVTGCMTTAKMNETMSSWEGSPIGDLIAVVGPPSQVIDAGGGARIYCFDASVSLVLPGTTSTYGNAYTYGNQTSFSAFSQRSPGSTIPISRIRMFWAKEDGIIYRWSWKGLYLNAALHGSGGRDEGAGDGG